MPAAWHRWHMPLLHWASSQHWSELTHVEPASRQLNWQLPPTQVVPTQQGAAAHDSPSSTQLEQDPPMHSIGEQQEAE